jgi:excisionase family DNA binding protein
VNIVMTVEEVADYLQVHTSTIYRLLKRHEIPAFKLGSDWRFKQESIDRWISQRESAHGLSDELHAKEFNGQQAEPVKLRGKVPSLRPSS